MAKPTHPTYALVVKTPEDERLMERLVRAADALYGGHLTILKFTTSWRIRLGTPRNFTEMRSLPEGRTFAEAAQAALDQAREAIEQKIADDMAQACAKNEASARKWSAGRFNG